MTDKVANEIGGLMQDYEKLNGAEKKFAKTEQQMDRDLSDML